MHILWAIWDLIILCWGVQYALRQVNHNNHTHSHTYSKEKEKKKKASSFEFLYGNWFQTWHLRSLFFQEFTHRFDICTAHEILCNRHHRLSTVLTACGSCSIIKVENTMPPPASCMTVVFVYGERHCWRMQTVAIVMADAIRTKYCSDTCTTTLCTRFIPHVSDSFLGVSICAILLRLLYLHNSEYSSAYPLGTKTRSPGLAMHSIGVSAFSVLPGA